MSAYDTDSGTNGRLTPLVGVDSNAISLYLGSSADATQAKSWDVTAFANLSKAMQRTRVSVGSVTTAAATCVRSDRDHYRIIVSYRLLR